MDNFLKDYKLSVGVSIDGPPEIHNSRRFSKTGKGTWEDVKRGIDKLREAEIPFGALTVVDECVISYGVKITILGPFKTKTLIHFLTYLIIY